MQVRRDGEQGSEQLEVNEMEPQDQIAVGSERLRTLADSLDCLTEEDLALLTGASPLTLRQWRKAGEGPSYVQACRRPLYPRQEVAKWMLTRMRTCAPRAAAAKELL